jgi:hypothetical protein
MAAVVALVALILAGGGCASGSFDRSAAADRVLARYGDRLTREQARCYVDRVVDEVGSDAVDDDSPPPEQVARLTRIRIDCAGVASLGTSLPPTTRTPAPGGTTGAMRVGSDPALDALHQACVDGSGADCDELFDRAPLGSEYEEAALTCGGRTTELRCADVYGGGRVR